MIRPGGELRVYERIIATNERFARLQRRAAGITAIVGGGCRPDRDTLSIERAGFEVERCRRFPFRPSVVA